MTLFKGHFSLHPITLTATRKSPIELHAMFKMSNAGLLFMPFLCLLLLLSPYYVLAIRTLPIVKAGVAERPLGSKPGEYTTFKPKLLRPGEHGSQNGNVESCLPKGFRRTSAPSRYVNYHTLGSRVCSTGKNMNDQP